MDDLQEFTLPAGTVCKRGGIPFELTSDTVIQCHPDNWPLIRDGFVPECDGQRLFLSQTKHSSDKPCVAQVDLSSKKTTSSSFESRAERIESRT